MRDRGKRGEEGEDMKLVCTLRPAKTEETVSDRQNNNVQEVGTKQLVLLLNLLFQQLCGTKSQRQCP